LLTPSAASSAEPSPLETGTSILDLDLDSADRSQPTSLPRTFNIDTHISYLQRDIQQLERLDSVVEATLGRTVHRIKERLGRRVWSGKDVWFRDEQARVPVSKEAWREAVNFVAPQKTKFLRGQCQGQKMRQP
jgi:hypothetical protein